MNYHGNLLINSHFSFEIQFVKQSGYLVVLMFSGFCHGIHENRWCFSIIWIHNNNFNIDYL